MNPLIPPQANMIVQIALLVLLLVSLGLKRRHKYLLHGATMLIAVLLSVFSLLLIMLPSLFSLEIIKTQPLHILSVITLTHVAVGVLADLLALLLVASWVLQPSVQKCARRKRLMRITLWLWLTALFVGVLFYAYAYTNLIP
ncbi:hypothetical protein MUP01_02865 [Candidatus Bathyarchaeota archaeon]|nr:hypothetical protein [Candidatus Bathyarchaeota archaeon]